MDQIMADEDQKRAWLLNLYEKRREILLQQENRMKMKSEQSKRGSVVTQRKMQLMAEMEMDDDALMKRLQKADEDGFQVMMGQEGDEEEVEEETQLLAELEE